MLVYVRAFVVGAPLTPKNEKCQYRVETRRQRLEDTCGPGVVDDPGIVDKAT